MIRFLSVWIAIAASSYGLAKAFEGTKDAGEEFLVLVPIIVGIFLLPTITAFARHHHSTGMVFIGNVTVGLTGVGWFIIFAYALGWIGTAARALKRELRE